MAFLNRYLDSTTDSITTVPSATVQPVSGTVTANAGTNLNTSALALETGGNLATIAGKDFATQTTLAITNTEIGIVTETAPVSDTASSGLNGRLQRIAQRISSLIALLPTALTGSGNFKTAISEAIAAGTNLIGKFGIDQTTPGTTNAVSLSQINSTTTVTGGVNGTLAIGGSVATNTAIGTNPVNLGAQAVSSENAAVTTGRLAQLITDLVGKLITLPYANPENLVSGAITTPMTGTTSTSLLASPGGSLRNYITTIICSNSHATVGTDIVIQDGSGGTVLMTIPAAAVYGGAVITLPAALRQPTAATALFCANLTTGASTKVSVVGYKGV